VLFFDNANHSALLSRPGGEVAWQLLDSIKILCHAPLWTEKKAICNSDAEGCGQVAANKEWTDCLHQALVTFTAHWLAAYSPDHHFIMLSHALSPSLFVQFLHQKKQAG